MFKIYNTYFLAAISTIGGMLFGFDISSLSAIIGTDQYLYYFNHPAGVVQGGIGASLAGGSVVGSIIAGPISDKFGRRDGVFIACLFWLVGTAIQVASQGIGMLVAGRFINGICVGITSSQVPVYLAEITKHDKRGSIIVIQQWAIEWGILIMYFVGYGCSFIGTVRGTYAFDNGSSFRTAFGIQFVPCVLLMIGIPFLPRSPRWLAKKGRDAEAIQILANIQAQGDTEHALVKAEWEEITVTLQAERNAYPGWRKFVYNNMWKRSMVGFSVQAWQQLSGANVMTYYVVYVFQMAGLRGNVNLVASGVQYAIFVVFTAMVFFFIDKTGRRPLLIYGALAMGICHFVVGGVIGTYGSPAPGGVGGNPNVVVTLVNAPKAGHTVMAFSYLLVIAYSLTLAPVAWVYAAEVWSLETRASGMGLAALGNWLFNFAIGFFIPPGFKNISWKIFIIFGVLCFGAAVQAFFTYPETAGKTLEEIEKLFVHGAPKPWHTHPGESALEEKVKFVERVEHEVSEKQPAEHLE